MNKINFMQSAIKAAWDAHEQGRLTFAESHELVDALSTTFDAMPRQAVEDLKWWELRTKQEEKAL